MGKFAKPTTRQLKKQVKKCAEEKQLHTICVFLGNKWKHPVVYKCIHCLREAYQSVLNDTQGYVTDDELIASSNNTLKRK